MAADRAAKWTKYFASGLIETKIRKTSEKVIVYDGANNTIDCLSSAYPVIVPPAKVYNPLYYIHYSKNGQQMSGFVKQRFVSKPVQTKGATEALQIKTADFVENGSRKFIDIKDRRVFVSFFYDHKTLGKSILDGLSRNINISGALFGVVQQLMETDELKWPSGTSVFDKNELGKYIGEVLYPYFIMKDKSKTFFNEYDIRGVCFPIDPTYSGYDAYLLHSDDHSMIPISNKYNDGAKASFFSNILLATLQTKALPLLSPDTVLYKVVESANRMSVSQEDLIAKRKSRNILYDYSIRHTLEFHDKPYDALAIMNNITVNNITDQERYITDLIRVHPDVTDKIVEKLPMSTTGFFSRCLARDLNRCRDGVTFIKNKLFKKNLFYQVNLETNDWMAGKVTFIVKHSSGLDIKFCGTKSPLDNPKSSQGTVNYELRERY